MKWFTCTPVSFRGDDSTFFSRDSGAFCRAFQALGVESKAVMPTPAYDDDDPSLIRTEYRNLESADWWRQFDLDGVLLYVWSIAKYRSVVEAIRKAGAKTVLYQDCDSAVFPWYEWRLGVRMMRRRSRLAHPGNGCAAWADFLFRFVKGHAAVLNYPARRRLFSAADAATFPYPAALDAWRRIPALVPERIRESAFVVPCPVSSRFRYGGTPKDPMVVAVGRWDDEEQKRGSLLLRTMEEAWKRRAVSFHVFGTTPPTFEKWRKALPSGLATHVAFHGIVPNAELAGWYDRAQVSLCTSIHESTHIASAEAVCCGCTVVAPPLPSVSCCHWYASEASGTIAREDTADALAEAVLSELDAWNAGKRNPAAVSSFWCDRLHATRSAERILRHFERA